MTRGVTILGDSIFTATPVPVNVVLTKVLWILFLSLMKPRNFAATVVSVPWRFPERLIDGTDLQVSHKIFCG